MSTCAAAHSHQQSFGASSSGSARRPSSTLESRPYKEAGLAYLRMDDTEIVERIAANPGLLRLPLVRFDAEVAAGRDEATWKRWVMRRGA